MSDKKVDTAAITLLIYIRQIQKKKNYVDLANISLCFYVKLLTKNIWSRWGKNTYIQVIIYCLISQVWGKGTPNIVPHKRIRNNQVIFTMN